jgi:hypothetical protein
MKCQTAPFLMWWVFVKDKTLALRGEVESYMLLSLCWEGSKKMARKNLLFFKVSAKGVPLILKESMNVYFSLLD